MPTVEARSPGKCVLNGTEIENGKTISSETPCESRTCDAKTKTVEIIGCEESAPLWMPRCDAEPTRRVEPKTPDTPSAVPAMFTLPAAAFCAIVIISVTTQANADLSFPTARCHVVQIPDVMGIKQCLNGTLNLCGLTKHDRKVASKKLGKCLVSSLSTRNFFAVLLGLLRAGLRFALRIAFPGSTSVVYPFWVRVKTFFRRRKRPEA
ncbi:hypothetical protein MRX96_000861 [Rhipicephalus microplus]